MAAASESSASSGWSLARRLLSSRWIAVHLLVCTAVITMVELGLWQLRVSDRKHFDLQNFSYVLQWWAFAAFTVAFWLRAMYNVHRPPNAADPGGALVLRGGSGGAGVVAQAGPADLVAPAYSSGNAAVYRGYVIPQSGQVPHRSEGDSHHALYNDYLWQLSLGDAASPRDRLSFYPPTPEATGAPASEGADTRALAGAAPPTLRRVIDAGSKATADESTNGPGAHS